MHSQTKARLIALSAVLMWSTVATAFKLALQYMDPIQLLALASLTSTLVLWAIVLWQGKLSLAMTQLRQHLRFYCLLGLLNPFLYYLVLFRAYDLLPAQQAQTINYSWAIVLSLLSVPLLGKKMTRLDVLASLLAYTGVVIIATGGAGLALHSFHTFGIVLALASTLVWGLYFIFNTKQQTEPLVGIALCFICGLPWTWTLCLLWSPPISIPWQGLLAAAYVGVFEMGITYVLWLTALKLTSNISRVSNLIFLSPFISLVLINLVLKEPLAYETFVGLTLIILGTLVQQRQPAT